MKLVLFFCFMVSFVFADKQYTNKYDNVDVEKILTNNRVLTNYIKCMMEEGPCTPEGRELKSKCQDFGQHFFFLFNLIFHIEFNDPEFPVYMFYFI